MKEINIKIENVDLFLNKLIQVCGDGQGDVSVNYIKIMYENHLKDLSYDKQQPITLNEYINSLYEVYGGNMLSYYIVEDNELILVDWV